MIKPILFCLFLFLVAACGSGDGSTVTELHWSSAQLNNDFDIRGITCGDNDTVIAVGTGGRVAKSENGGTSWVPAGRPVAGLLENLNSITYCGNKFMIAGDNHTILASVDQGQTWTTVANYPFPEISFQSAACNGNSFLLGGQTNLSRGAVNFDNRTAFTANGGTDWGAYSVSGIIQDNTSYVGIKHLMYAGGYYYLATDGGISGYSSGGTTWNKLLTPVNANFDFTGMAQGTDNGTKLTFFSAAAPGDNATGRLVVYYNDNITEWKDAALPVTDAVRGVAFGKDTFVALTDNDSYITDNHTYKLDDNYTVSWKKDEYPTTARDFRINTVTYCGGAFWAATNKGQIFRSLY